MSIRRPALAFDSVTVITNAILRDPNLSPAEKGLLGYVLSHSAGYELTMKQMIAENRAGRDAIDNALTGLQRRGYLTRTRQRSAGGQLGGYDWEVTIDPIGHPTGPIAGDAMLGKPALVASRANEASSQVGTSAGFPTAVGTTLAGPAPKNSKVLELELDLELQEQNRSAPAEPDPFGEWWRLYPKKVGKNAADVAYRKAWRKVGTEPLLEGLRRYVAWLGPDPDHRFTAHPSTWLNQGRWSDELPAKRATTSGSGLVERNGVLYTPQNAQAYDLLTQMRMEEAVASVALSHDPTCQTRALEEAPW